MIDVKIWLKQRGSYNDGVHLYSLYGKSAILLRQLKIAEHSINRKKLLKALEEIADRSDELIATVIPYKPPQQAPPPKYDKEIDKYYKEAAMLYKEAGKLHATSLWSDDIEVRSRAAIEIRQKMDRNVECYDIIYYWEQHGFLPSKNKNFKYLKTYDKAQLITIRNNNRSYLSKTKKKLKGLTSDDKNYKKFTEEITRRTKENEAINLMNVI